MISYCFKGFIKIYPVISIFIILLNLSNKFFYTFQIPEKNFSNIVLENQVEEEKLDIERWELEIPKINLHAQISEGTQKEVLDEYIGHFAESPKEFGNVCLAGHNRGYNVNYFARIKELELNDKIYYTYNGIKNLYIVSNKCIIEDTDWSRLENTNENILTLITCVENEPKHRRCIQGVRVDEKV